MSLFSWLILGHLVGDWMLQNDWMARNKCLGLSRTALLVHCAIYTATVVAVIGLADGDYGFTQLLMSSWVVFLSHWLIDGLQLARHWRKLMRQSDLAFVQIMSDQTLHVGVLAVLAVIIPNL